MNNWYIGEIKDIKFGDTRLNNRLETLINSMSKSNECSIPQACNGWGETMAAYRFFNNDNVTSEKILSSHQISTLERIQKEKVVLIPQDTTEINFTGRKDIKDMGCLSSEKRQGFLMHPSIVITPQKICLGIVDLQIWNRQELGQRKLSKNRIIEDKESYRWVKGYGVANRIAELSPNTTVISISDREGDIYETLEKTPSKENKAYWIIRSSMNRKIIKDEVEQRKLWDKVKSSKVIGEIEFKLPKGKIYERKFGDKRLERCDRSVTQEVRACQITLCPAPRKGLKLKPTIINIVHCKEINPPSEKERIEWFLLTSMDLTDSQSILKVVDYYLARWQIEIFFKILKSGCNIEKLQFTTFKALCNCIALYMIISWRILYITMISRIYPNINCDKVFCVNEWQSVYIFVQRQPPPTEPPSVLTITNMIAGLGGFLKRKHDGYPGPKVMWRGIQRAKDLSLMREAMNSMSK